METVEQFPFVLCAWPSFADQPYITNYRIYDDRVGETTRFTYRPDHEWYWFPQQKPTEVSMLKCYDSVTDGSASRWSFHTAVSTRPRPPTPDAARTWSWSGPLPSSRKTGRGSGQRKPTSVS
jgi:hypothetical protein